MFNRLNRGKEQTSQGADDSVSGAVYEALLETGDELASQWAATAIVDAVAEVRETSSDYILDERKLPYPKEVIRLAFRKRISFWKERCRQEPNNPESKRRLELHRMVADNLSSFQTIDPEDEQVVRAANEWNKQLKFQSYDQRREYIERAIKSDKSSALEWLALGSKYLDRTMKESRLYFDDWL